MGKSGWGYFSFFRKKFLKNILKNISWAGGGLEEDCDQQSGAGVRRSSEKFGEVRRSSEKFGEVRRSSGIYIRDHPQATVGPEIDSWRQIFVAPDKSIGFIWTHPTAELSQKAFFETASAV